MRILSTMNGKEQRSH